MALGVENKSNFTMMHVLAIVVARCIWSRSFDSLTRCKVQDPKILVDSRGEKRVHTVQGRKNQIMVRTLNLVRVDKVRGRLAPAPKSIGRSEGRGYITNQPTMKLAYDSATLIQGYSRMTDLDGGGETHH